MDCIFDYYKINDDLSSELLVLLCSIVTILLNTVIMCLYYWFQKYKWDLKDIKSYIFSGCFVIWNYYNVPLLTICNQKTIDWP